MYWLQIWFFLFKKDSWWPNVYIFCQTNDTWSIIDLSINTQVVRAIHLCLCELREDQLNNGMWLEQRIRLGRASAPAGRPGRAASTYMAAVPACQSWPAKIHVSNYYGISNILLFVLGKAKVLLSWLDCFFYPSRPSQVLFSWTLFSSESMPFQKIFFITVNT